MNTDREYIPNNLVWAILSTLLCCLPLGIVSIVYAAKVDGLSASGNTDAARDAANSAKNWAIAAAVSGPVVAIIWLMFMGGMAALGGM